MMNEQQARSVQIAAWIATLSLVVIAALSGLNYLAAEDHRQAEVDEWSRLATHQAGITAWECFSSGIELGRVSGNSEVGNDYFEVCAGMFGGTVDRNGSDS